jgi:N-acylneuraminate cytidylyltransferase
MNIVAIIPARGGSKGVPRKNIKLLDGKPLLSYAIDAALKSNFIKHVVVNTEDTEIASIAAKYPVIVQSRPEKFWHDNTFQEVDRLLEWSVIDLEENHFNSLIDIVVLLYPTSPLRTTDDIDQCVELVANGNCDSSLSLCEDRSYLWRYDGNFVNPTNYDPHKRGPNQLEGWNQWRENKAVYCMTRSLLIDTRCRLGGKICGSAMSKLNSVDIDLPEDFALVESIIESRK